METTTPASRKKNCPFNDKNYILQFSEAKVEQIDRSQKYKYIHTQAIIWL